MVLNDIASDQKRLVNRCAGLCLLIVLLGAARNDSTRLGLPDQTETRVSAALNGLQESYTVETAPRLKSIISDLTAGVDVRTIDPPNYIARRRLVVRAWARIFSALDNSYDSSYDIHDRRNTVYICLVPPREADGKQLMSCGSKRGERSRRASDVSCRNCRESSKYPAADHVQQVSQHRLGGDTGPRHAIVGFPRRCATRRGLSRRAVTERGPKREAEKCH